VRRSVRSVRGNQWMFRIGHPADHPLRIRPELLLARLARRALSHPARGTPVRMDLSHSGWSDIFFLGMDFPEGARVLNVSIDLGVRGRDAGAPPPVEAYFRVIDEPVLRLASVDLGRTAEITSLAEVFDFAATTWGCSRPPSSPRASSRRAWKAPAAAGRPAGALVGPGRGIEIVSRQRHPQGLAAGRLHQPAGLPDRVCMRATGQAASLTGRWPRSERRWSPRAPSSANGWAAPAAAGRIPAASGRASS
jgi:hypothetical protein